MPGLNLPADPLFGAIGPPERFPGMALDRSGKTPTVNFAPMFRDLWEDVVVGSTHQFLVAKVIVVPETAARRQVSHLAVEHGDGYRSELRETPQVSSRLAELLRPACAP